VPERTIKTKYYEYSQNNSGGSFVLDFKRGIGHTVWVEATSKEDADRRAEAIGLYFDGYGDCSCCGNRWSEAWGDGEEIDRDAIHQSLKSGGGMRTVVFVHNIDGSFDKIGEGTENDT
jgi:hypothetical protein